MRGAEAMRKFEPDWIVSMGGGSPIDAAKAMWAFYEYPETTFEDLITPFSFPELRQKARFAAIPSTSGTATEVTAFSVITNYQTGVKYPLADFNITPDVAIVDPDLVMGLPVKQVAYTGMDALTHAIEAYVSTLRIRWHFRRSRWFWNTFRHLTMEIPMRERRCITRSVSREWHSLMRFLESFTLWPTRRELRSPPDIFRTDARTRSIFRMSSSITRRIPSQLSVTRRSQEEWD